MANSDQLINEAKMLREEGRPAEAVLRYRQVIKADPDNQEALYGWAGIAFERGNAVNAEKLLMQLLAKAPGHAGGCTMLGSIYMWRGRYGWASQYFQKALESDPGYLPAYNNLAIIRMSAGDPWGAEEFCREGLARDNAFGAIYNTLGQALIAQGRAEEAVAALEDAVRLSQGRDAEYLCNLGVLYLNIGDSKKAAQALRRAIKADPDHVNAHYTFSGVHKYKVGDPHIVSLETLLQKKNPASQEAGWLHFALGKAWHDLRDYDQAFEHYAQGNFIIRSCFTYKPDTTRKNFSRIKKDYGGNFTAKELMPRKDDPVPIFVVGLPRSGTTLAEQILASHPLVGAAGEVTYLQNLYYEHKIWDTPASGEGIAAIPEDALRAVRDSYLEKLRRHAPGARYITDKLPVNFQLAGLIRILFPQAKIIHCRRDPMDNCFSIYRCVFNGMLYFAYDLQELGKYYKNYEDLMGFWHEKLPGFIYDVQYEKLVADQEAVTRDLLAFCGLPWDSSCLDFHKTKRVVTTASALQVKKPLYSSGVGSWCLYEKHLRLLEKELI